VSLDISHELFHANVHAVKASSYVRTSIGTQTISIQSIDEQKVSVGVHVKSVDAKKAKNDKVHC
jgi:outer membrane scaffolding protein for murein synthesis (MipA/OmpV family)